MEGRVGEGASSCSVDARGSEADRPHSALEPGDLPGLFDEVRELFAATAAAKGRCDRRPVLLQRGGRTVPHCEGEGFVRVELLFMPSVYAPCPTCHGRRFNVDLKVSFLGRNVAEVLEMTRGPGREFFAEYPMVDRPCDYCRRWAWVSASSDNPPPSSRAARRNGSSSPPNCSAAARRHLVRAR